MSRIMDGKLVAHQIKSTVKEYIERNDAHLDLTIVQVGDNPASNTYIKNKVKACEEVGIQSTVLKFTDLDEYDRCVDIPDTLKYITGTGAMLQLPLPEGWHEDYFVNLIPSNQDADCLTNESLGKFYSSSNPKICPCTAQGIMDLLDFYGVELAGKRALVIGRSNIVGRPVAHLLETRNATVTLAHSKTPRSELLRLFATSDIVVVAVGKPNFITEEDACQYNKDWRHDFYSYFDTKRNRVIIDVGINRDENGKLCGDLSEEFKAKYSELYSPVPGGVGPLTVANLLYNTVKLHHQEHKNDTELRAIDT